MQKKELRNTWRQISAEFINRHVVYARPALYVGACAICMCVRATVAEQMPKRPGKTEKKYSNTGSGGDSAEGG